MFRKPPSSISLLGSHRTYGLTCSRLMSTSTRRVLDHHKQSAASIYHNHRLFLSQGFQRSPIRSQHGNFVRRFGDKAPGGGGDKSKGIPDSERTDIVLTPGQKVVEGTRLAMYLAMLGGALTCLYFTARELIPTKMSPNTVFNNAHSILQNSSDVNYRFGTPIKTFGRDHGGSREGRRNFVEHSEYTDKEDGSKRVRVRFNLEGPKGQAFVFAEVSSDMPSGEFVYLLVQDKRNGRVITVIDNRSMLAAKRMAAGSKEGEDVFASLLSGGKK